MAHKRADLKTTVKNDVESRQIQAAASPAKVKNDASIIFRLPKAQFTLLEDHFSKRGLKLSQGIRMIVSEYIERRL